MCVAIPGKIVEIYDNECIVDFGKIKKKVNTLLIEDIKIGDYVLVHAGCAIEKVNKEEALETLELFKMISDEIGDRA
jgi:hydrogenase expression/formation protein HypC